MAEIMLQMHQEEMKLREAGQKEYAHEESNTFANFERPQEMFNIDRKKVLWVFLQKHLDGIVAYINGHRSQREDVRGRIADARVYLSLLRGMIEEEENDPRQPGEIVNFDPKIAIPTIAPIAQQKRASGYEPRDKSLNLFRGSTEDTDIEKEF